MPKINDVDVQTGKDDVTNSGTSEGAVHSGRDINRAGGSMSHLATSFNSIVSVTEV